MTPTAASAISDIAPDCAAPPLGRGGVHGRGLGPGYPSRCATGLRSSVSRVASRRNWMDTRPGRWKGITAATASPHGPAGQAAAAMMAC